MTAPSDKNLSETLFNRLRGRKAKETSEVSFSQPFEPCDRQEQVLIDGLCTASWFRVLRRAYWIWQGGDMIEMEDVLAKIATSDAERTHPELLDTVKGFIPGNWCYEWSQLAGEYNKRAKELETDNQLEAAQAAYFKASHYYSIASYPHLKGDELAEQAQVMANLTYRDAGKLMSVPLRELKIPYQKKEIKAYMHLPHDNHAIPMVIVSGAIDSLQTDFIRFFQTKLAPLGIGMISMDLPGCGYSSAWSLEEDTSRLHQVVLQYLKELPWVDDHKVGMVGFRLSGNAAVRLAFLEPSLLKAVVCVGPGMHQYFTDRNEFNKSPPMMRASLANRLGQDASDWDGLQQSCQVFSLKRQGLAGTKKTTVPILSIGHKDDFICPEVDIKMLARSSAAGKAVVLDKEPVKEQMDIVFSEISDWLKQHFF